MICIHRGSVLRKQDHVLLMEFAGCTSECGLPTSLKLRVVMRQSLWKVSIKKCIPLQGTNLSLLLLDFAVCPALHSVCGYTCWYDEAVREKKSGILTCHFRVSTGEG